MKQLVLKGLVVKEGTILSFPDVDEGGVVVGIDYQLEEVYLYDGKEGWTVSSEYGNLRNLKFETV
jgi:hypothetical protein